MFDDETDNDWIEEEYRFGDENEGVVVKTLTRYSGTGVSRVSNKFPVKSTRSYFFEVLTPLLECFFWKSQLGLMQKLWVKRLKNFFFQAKNQK